MDKKKKSTNEMSQIKSSVKQIKGIKKSTALFKSYNEEMKSILEKELATLENFIGYDCTNGDARNGMEKLLAKENAYSNQIHVLLSSALKSQDEAFKMHENYFNGLKSIIASKFKSVSEIQKKFMNSEISEIEEMCEVYNALMPRSLDLTQQGIDWIANTIQKLVDFENQIASDMQNFEKALQNSPSQHKEFMQAMHDEV